jgi:hypothetical protein
VELAARLADDWESLHLFEIVPSARPEIQGDRRYFVYDLRSGGGTQIIWGAPPQEDLPGEDEFDVKLHRLKQCAAQYGPLARLARNHEHSAISISSGKRGMLKMRETAGALQPSTLVWREGNCKDSARFWDWFVVGLIGGLARAGILGKTCAYGTRISRLADLASSRQPTLAPGGRR